jgi:F0F1-type ATP synthase membrane subunit b/b'
MGERTDPLNDSARAPYVPGGYTPQGDEMADTAAGIDTEANTASGQIQRNMKEASTQMSETIDDMQDQLSPENLKAQGTDTVKQTSIQTKDTASQKQKLQQMASQVSEKTGPVLNQAATQARQLGDQAQRQARMVRAKYGELQERTGIQITPQMLGIAAGVLAGAIALVVTIRRLLGRGTASEETTVVAEVPLDTLPTGKYMLTRID